MKVIGRSTFEIMQKCDGEIHRLIRKAPMPGSTNPSKHPTPPPVKRAKTMRRRADARCKASKAYRKWRDAKKEARSSEKDRRSKLRAEIHQAEIDAATAIRIEDTVEMDVVVDEYTDVQMPIPSDVDVSYRQPDRPIPLHRATEAELSEVIGINFAFVPDGEHDRTMERQLPRPEVGIADHRAPWGPDGWENITKG